MAFFQFPDILGFFHNFRKKKSDPAAADMGAYPQAGAGPAPYGQGGIGPQNAPYGQGGTGPQNGFYGQGGTIPQSGPYGQGEAGPQNSPYTQPGPQNTPYGPAGPQSGPYAPERRPRKSVAAKKKRRRIIRIAVILLIAGGVGFALFRRFAGGSGGPDTTALTDIVHYGAIPATVEGSGLTRAKNSETLVLGFAGTIQEVFVEEGDIVSAGDPLYILDSEDARKAVTDAEDGVTKAREAVTSAQEAVAAARDRVRTAQEGVRTAEDNVTTAEEGVLTAQDAVVTAREGITTAEEAVETALEGVETAKDGVNDAREAVVTAREAVDTARERVEDAKKDLETARRNLAEAEDDLGETEGKRNNLSVRADFAGKILEPSKIEKGNKLATDAAIATLADDQHLRLTQWYASGYRGQIREGQTARIQAYNADGLMLEEDEPVTGTVETVYSSSRGAERLFSVDIIMNNPGAYDAGLEARAYVVLDSGETAAPDGAEKLEYARTEELTAVIGGKVLSVNLINYGQVAEGEELLLLDDSILKDEIEAARDKVEEREKAVTNAEKAVTDAQKGVTDAQKGVTTAEKGVETAQKNVTTAEKGVETARKNVENAKKGVTDAERGVDNARRSVESAKRGVEDAEKAVTDAEKGVTDAEKNVEDQRKGVEDAQEKLAKAEENLAKCSAAASIDGRVVGLDIAAGEEVTSGKAALTISDTTSLIVSATVDERNMGYIKKGMMVNLNQWDQAFAVGMVESISLSSTVNNGVATYPMTISMDNGDGAIQVNSNIQYSLVASQNDNCLIVPIQCVRSVSTEDGESMTVVYCNADGAEPEGVVEGVNAGEMIPDGYWPVRVETGIQDTINVEIRSGLQEGWEVFTQMQSNGMGFGMYW